MEIWTSSCLSIRCSSIFVLKSIIMCSWTWSHYKAILRQSCTWRHGKQFTLCINRLWIDSSCFWLQTFQFPSWPELTAALSYRHMCFLHFSVLCAKQMTTCSHFSKFTFFAHPELFFCCDAYSLMFFKNGSKMDWKSHFLYFYK